MLRLNGLTEYWEGLSDKIWNVEDDGTTCDILIKKTPSLDFPRLGVFYSSQPYLFLKTLYVNWKDI